MAYSLNLDSRVIKSLSKINEPMYSLLKEAIYNLAENPRPFGYRKLKGKLGYRICVGDYRIIYTIQDKILVVEVVALGHRKDIYE